MTNRARSWLKLVAMLLVFGFVGMNFMAYMHAKAMVNFSDIHDRTQSPEELSLSAKFKVLLFGVNLPRPDNNRTPADIGLAFDTHSYQGADSHTLEAWSIPAENEDFLIILFHGYADSKETLLPTAKQLNELGLRTFLVDFYGSGGSSGNRTTVGYLESRDVSQSFYYAKEKWPQAKVILYGYSMGGAALLKSIATDEIEPDGVVLEATFDRMLSTVQNRFHSMGLPATPLANLLVFWGGWQSGFNAFNHNPADYAQFVTSPSLVIHGQHDPRVTSTQADAVYQQLNGWKKFSNYALAGHETVLNTDLSKWREDIRNLVAQVKSN